MMMQTDIARAKRMHSALMQRRSVLAAELTDAQKRFERMIEQAHRDPALAGVDAQKAQLARIGELQRTLAEHDRQAVEKLKQRTAGAQSHE